MLNHRIFWLLASLVNFLLAALIGLLLRGAFVWEFDWMDYRKFLHAHSHIAMLGWVYLILYTLLVEVFLGEKEKSKTFYGNLFWATQFSVLGMAVSFPIQGYGAVSIGFTSIHLLLSYVFVSRLWKDRKVKNNQLNRLLKWSLLFLLVSTLGIWGLGITMNVWGNTSPLYIIAIQFYLHFQFNGWFLMAVFLFLLKYFLSQNIHIQNSHFNRFLGFYIAGTFATFFHVLEWAYGEDYMVMINSIGVGFQLLAFVSFFLPIRNQLLVLGRSFKSVEKSLLLFAMTSIFLKASLQGMLVFPEVAEVSTTMRNFMIGYIHLINLGIVSTIIFFILGQWIAGFRLGVSIYLIIIGIVGTEIVLFYHGMASWLQLPQLDYYHLILFVISILLPLGIIGILLQNFRFNGQLKTCH